MIISVKRVYDKPGPKDGVRILVDRLWPRGLSKVDAKIDVWLKAVAPSNELRRWYGHDPQKWAEFKKRYFAELDTGKDVVTELLSHVRKGRASLLFAAKDPLHNNAAALKEYIDGLK